MFAWDLLDSRCFLVSFWESMCNVCKRPANTNIVLFVINGRGSARLSVSLALLLRPVMDWPKARRKKAAVSCLQIRKGLFVYSFFLRYCKFLTKIKPTLWSLNARQKTCLRPELPLPTSGNVHIFSRKWQPSLRPSIVWSIFPLCRIKMRGVIRTSKWKLRRNISKKTQCVLLYARFF